MLKIGRSAAKLFHEKGYVQTTTNDIAKAAKLSEGCMYYYFASKDEILYFILKNQADLVVDGLEEELKCIQDSYSKLQFIVSRHIRLYTSGMPESKILLHEAYLLSRNYFKIIAEKERKYYEILKGVLAEIFGSCVSKERLTAITFTILGMCNWIGLWYDPKGPLSPQELTDIIYNILVTGIRNYANSVGRAPQNLS